MPGVVVNIGNCLLPKTRALHFLVGTALHFSIGIHKGKFGGLSIQFKRVSEMPSGRR